MVKRFIIEVDSDDKHVLDAAGYDAPVTKAQVTAEALGDLLSVLESSTTESYEDVMPEEGIGLTHALWGLLAALCFVAGLSIGFSLYFRSSLSLYIEDYLRRCCRRGIRGRAGADPVLLTVVDRQSEDSIKKDGEEDTDSDKDNESKNTVNSPQAKGDGTSGEGEKETKDDGKTEGEKDCKEEDGKSSSSSSSEGEDDEGSVRQRKKAAAEGKDGEDAAPETEDKGEDEQHKE